MYSCGEAKPVGLVTGRLPCKIFFAKVNNKFLVCALCPLPLAPFASPPPSNKRIEIALVLHAPCSFYRGYISLFSVLLHMTEGCATASRRCFAATCFKKVALPYFPPLFPAPSSFPAVCHSFRRPAFFPGSQSKD